MQVVYNNVRCIMEKQGILDEESYMEIKVKINVNGIITFKESIIGQMANKFDYEWLKEFSENNQHQTELEKVKLELVDAYMEIARLKDITNNPEFKEAVSKVGELLVERDELQGGILELAKLLGRR